MQSNVATLVEKSSSGDPQAASDLFLLLYDELRQLARGYVRRERFGQSIGATGLVHEAYMRLIPDAPTDWEDRTHFLAIAARAMRQVLVAHARTRSAQKRGGGVPAVTLNDVPIEAALGIVDLIALDDAMTELATHDARMAELVELRFFGGLTLEEAAKSLDISPATAKRWWTFARTWLRRKLES
jgi:RNA polymerase sigma factor (TIGR02999 family)